MSHPLLIHPGFRCAVIDALTVEVERVGSQGLRLRYVGRSLSFVARAGARTDELWRHTCLEAFVRVRGEAGYRELNLAPSGAWAAYRFDAPRSGMANADIDPPIIEAAGEGEVAATWILDLPADVVWTVGVTAVIEDGDGALSYWSLRHPSGKPDFHHPDGFALELVPPSRP